MLSELWLLAELTIQKLIFPGVGSFGQATTSLRTSGLIHPLLRYLRSGKPYFGICIGMQMLFESSDESPGANGFGIIPATARKFSNEDTTTAKGKKSVPHMGWNAAWEAWQGGEAAERAKLMLPDEDYYFVHSFAVPGPSSSSSPLAPFVNTLSRYGDETFVSSVRLGNIFGCQFHPEKSGPAGLDLLRRWLDAPIEAVSGVVPIPTADHTPSPSEYAALAPQTSTWQPVNPNASRSTGSALTKRIVACLDVRSNDAGDLVVTKGDQYDVREKDQGGEVRNLGKPVELARRYYHAQADEICFLNITSFRSSALLDQPMLEVVKASAETVFVPLTIGGGIKDSVDPDGTPRSALEVAGAYFRSGADKVSIGSDAVFAVEELMEREARGEPALTGKTGIETIKEAYGCQAVVVSIDPRRVYVDTSVEGWLENFPKKHLPSLIIGKNAISRTAPQEQDKAWWYQATVQGGRAVRDVDVVQLAQGVEKLGAGEILLNSVDRDGSGLGFDLDLVRLVKDAVGIPVVASSGAGAPADFKEVFEVTDTEAALAAGIFHREEVEIVDVKQALVQAGLPTRVATLST